MARSGLPSKLKERRRRWRIFLSVFIPVLIAFLVTGAAYLTHWSAVAVSKITVVGASAVSPETLVESVNESLSGNYLGFFSKKNIFLYPGRSIEAALLARFPRLKQADLSIEDFHTLRLSVEERKLYALWCGASAPQNTNVATSSLAANCDFLDENGFIFSPAADFTGAVYMHYYGPYLSSASSSPLGSQFLPAHEFKQLDAFLRALESLSLSVVGAALISDKDAEVLLERNARLLVARSSDYSAALDNLRSALSSDVFEKNSMANLEYLDLRFGDHVFYKFR